MSKHTITTNPELIKLLGDKLYDRRLDAILIRELLQNAVDAGKKGSPIQINASWSPRSFYLTVDDQGCGMSEETLTGVFLNIGGSYKPTQNGDSTGGFGIAKVALFNADLWNVLTRDNHIDNTLELTKRNERIGTRVTCRKDWETDTGQDQYRIRDAVLLLHSCAVDGLVFNNTPVAPYKPRTRMSRHETSDGIPYTVRFAKPFEYPILDSTYRAVGYVFYRINGLTQCAKYGGEDLRRAERNIVVDFGKIGYSPTEKGYPFSMSRESVTTEIAESVDELLRKLAKDTMSTIRDADGRGNYREWTNPGTGLMTFAYDGRIYKPDLEDRRVARLWEEMVNTVWPQVTWTIGVTNEYGTNGSLEKRGTTRIATINPKSFVEHVWSAIEAENSGAVVMAMWHLAVHEVSHLTHSGHDEAFTSQEASLANNSVMRVADNMTKLRELARRLFQ